MVDVGYFIRGRHGGIKNVMQITNNITEHLCFVQVNGEEQYAIKKEDIDIYYSTLYLHLAKKY